MHAPPVVDEEVEDGEQENEEGSGPFGFESSYDHDGRSQAEEGDDCSDECKLAIKNKADEKEDEQHAACELKVLFPVCFRQYVGKSSKDGRFALGERIRQDHE